MSEGITDEGTVWGTSPQTSKIYGKDPLIVPKGDTFRPLPAVFAPDQVEFPKHCA